MKKLELYIHIPFCVRKCLYCDFLSAPADTETQEAYMKALLQEIAGRAVEYRDYLVDTVFIGGGTPSSVAALWIEHLMEVIRGAYLLSEEAEITMEVNPGTVDAKKLKTYRKAGINRLSIGLQSADDEELKRIGRIHTWEDFRETYSLARKVGFRNINVDVMSALPGQDLETYCNTLEQITHLTPQPEHISAYSLIVEDGTPFADMYEKGILQLPDEETERKMYEKTAELLAKVGYSRYEISNYAKEGFSCRHNVGYWRRVDYVGFGIGAASLVENKRFRNADKLWNYIENPLDSRCDLQELSLKEQMEEFMFLGLRMTEGVSEEAFRKAFGKSLEEVHGTAIHKNIEDGLLVYRNALEKLGQGGCMLALTEKGIDISNYVMAQFLFD